MKNKKMYFENEDSEICYSLDYHIENTKEKGLKEITLIEAVPDTSNKDIIWCSELEVPAEKSECNKTCPYYTAPEKGKICKKRGKLMEFGDSFKFSVDTSIEKEVKND